MPLTIWSLSIPVSLSLSRVYNPYYVYNTYKGNFQLIDDGWYIDINPFVTNENVGKQLLGTNFSRLGLKGRFNKAYISYKNNNGFELFCGRFPIILGYNDGYSIIQSGSSPNYDKIKLRLNLGILDGTFVIGQLGSERFNNKRIRRLLGIHKFSFNFFDDKFVFEIGEQIIYTGENRSVELFYLNPFIPYIFATYEYDDLTVRETDGKDYNNDNVMIFLYGHYYVKKTFSLFFEFLLDDYQIHNYPLQDMLGWRIGINSSLKIADYNINWRSNLTEIDSWTYIHHGQFTTWQDRGHPIGYPLGNDLRSLTFKVESRKRNDNISLRLEFSRLEKGHRNINEQWANIDNISDSFPSTPVKVFNLFESSIIYNLEYAVFEVGYTNIPFSYEIANGLIDELKNGLFFNLQLNLGFDFILEQD